MALAMLGVFAWLAAASRVRALGIVVPLALGALAVVLLAAWSSRSRVGRVLHDLSPAIWVPFFFDVAGPLIAVVNRSRWDRELAAIDVRTFGALPDAWRGALGRPRWLTDVASVAYLSFYVLPIVVGLALYVRGRKDDYARFAFTVQLTFFLSYLGYFVLPATGPRRSAEEMFGHDAVSLAVRRFLDVVEINRLDAFPSGHTAASLVVLVLGWRMLPRWRAPLVACVGAILFSTVYLSLHYVIDLFAGALLAALVPVVLPAFARAFGTPGHPPCFPEHVTR